MVDEDNLSDYLILLEPLVARWRRFGTALNMNPDTMEAIESKPNTLEPSDKMRKVLIILQRRNSLYWDDVVKAVRAMRNNRLAENLPQKGKGLQNNIYSCM